MSEFKGVGLTGVGLTRVDCISYLLDRRSFNNDYDWFITLFVVILFLYCALFSLKTLKILLNSEFIDFACTSVVNPYNSYHTDEVMSVTDE